MQILKAGDRGTALSPSLGRVPVVFEYRTVRLEKSGIEVPDVLVGVDEATGEVLTVPAQSTPRLREARAGRKELSCQVRMPRQLIDVLWMLAGEYRTDAKKFWPAAIRLYLSEAFDREPLRRRIARLGRTPIARSGPKKRFTIRVDRSWSEGLDRLVAAHEGMARTDFIRGAVLAAAEDTFDSKSSSRVAKLEAIARAV